MTNTATISTTRLAREGGRAYAQQWIGRTVIHTSYDGVRRAGTLTRFEGLYPIAEFEGGQWARLDLTIEMAG